MLSIVSAGIHDATPDLYHGDVQYILKEHVATVPKYTNPLIAKAVVPIDHHAATNYEFEYSVHDPHTGDAKNQKEIRHGHQVKGSYSLIEADGTKRVVEYTADAHHGFNAVVHREPISHPPPAKQIVVPSHTKVIVPVSKEVSAIPIDDGYSAYLHQDASEHYHY